MARRYGRRRCRDQDHGARPRHQFDLIWCTYCGAPPHTDTDCPYPLGHLFELVCRRCGKPASRVVTPNVRVSTAPFH